MSKKTVAQIAGAIVDELSDLTSEERHRVIRAALALLGEASLKHEEGAATSEESGAEVGQLPQRARVWMKQNDLSPDQLQQVFHIDGETIEIIASEVPGKNNREKVRNAYVLTGTAGLLSTGDPKFSDKAGRTLCEQSGFYDSSNHTKYMKGGNEFTGSADKGWTLTNPGLKAAANLIKDITKTS